MNRAATITPDPQVSRWPATLALRLARGPRGTRLVAREHSGPLYVQRPFYPEGADLAHIYLLHPPGGLVSGDELRYVIDMGPAAAALFTTPGAGRVYRARSDATVQEQQVTLRLAPGASAEWLPLETIVYPGAHARLCTRVELGEGSRFAGWEISCTGLPASDAPFNRGRLRQSFQLYRNGHPLLVETLNLDMVDERLYRGRAGLGGHCVSGLLVATIPANGEVPMAALRALAEEGRLSATALDDLLVVRYLGPCTHEARALLEAAWALLRPGVIGRPACTPRIWFT